MDSFLLLSNFACDFILFKVIEVIIIVHIVTVILGLPVVVITLVVVARLVTDTLVGLF